MLNIPMDAVDFDEELKIIKEIATVNGYQPAIIERLLCKHQSKKFLKSCSTLQPINSQSKYKRIGIKYQPSFTGKLRNVFKSVHMKIVPTSQFNLKSALFNTKDKSDNLSKSGVYSLKCSSCDQVYIGQSSRSIVTRWKEHNKNIAKNEPNKSSVAFHVLNNLDHDISIDNFKLIKPVSHKFKLDAWESLYIHKQSHLMNMGEPPIYSSLFDCVNL